MVERKQFKTKLCVPYQRGRCTRHNCSFAHGNEELRRFSSSYSGNDLRDKLDRRHLSPQRYSPARHSRGHQTVHDYHHPRPFGEKNDRKHRRTQVITGQSDVSGGLKVSGSRNSLEEQLKNVQLDINKLEDEKFQLGVYLDASTQEVDSLNSRIQELEAQLCKQNEECKRITLKIRKFIKAHNHNSRLQDELKRSQVRLQRLGDELALDMVGIGTNEEDLSIDIVSNGENTGFPPIIKRKMEHNEPSPHKKRVHVERDAVDESKQDKSKAEHLVETAKTRKRSRWNVAAPLNDMGYLGLEVPHTVTDVTRPSDLEGTHKRGIYNSSNNIYPEKLKESIPELPSTSMAARGVDEVEIELDDKTEIPETAHPEHENGLAFKVKGMPLLHPPVLTLRNNYSQYEGDDENVDIDGLDEDATGRM